MVQGQELGRIRVFVAGEEVESYPITACGSIERMDFAGGFRLLLDALLSL